jgi:hypothetical protein
VNKQTVLFGLSFTTVAGLAAPACLSNSTNPPDGGPDSSSGSSSSSSSSGGDAASSSSGVLVIDSMMGQQTESGGYWYTYDDRSVPNSEPPILLTTADGGPVAGFVIPAEGASFSPMTGGGPMVNGAEVPYRECSGGGEAKWGVGCGMDFVSFLPDGRPVGVNMCDSGTIFNTAPPAVDAGLSNVGIPQPFDLSAYTKVKFWGKSMGTVKSQTVYAQISEKRTSPWGGVCDPCLTNGATACADDFRTSFTFTSTWTEFTIDFSKMTRSNWSKAMLSPDKLDPKTAYYLHFQLPPAPPAEPAFDIGFAYITAVP